MNAAGWSIEGVRVVTTLEDNKLEAMREYMGDVELSKNSGCADAKRAFNDGVDTSEAMSRIVDACNEGKRHATITNLFIVGTAASAALATFFYYKGYISPKSKYESKPDGDVASRKRRKKEPETSIRVIPSVGPHSVGAGVTVEF